MSYRENLHFMNAQLSSSFGISLQTGGFPFKCVLSLSPLVAFWNQVGSSGHTVKAALARTVQEELQRAPELLEPIENLSFIEKHRDLVEILMSMVFPPASWEQQYSAATIPFHFRSFYATPAFERSLMPEDGTFEGLLNLDGETFAYGKSLKAYLNILRKFYGIGLEFEYPLICTRKDPETGLDRYFKLNIDSRFLEVKTVGTLTPLTDEAKKRLRANLTDLRVWMELIPPENFEFHGFSVINALDVTDQEVLSALKRDLIQKESLISNPRFQSLQERLRTLLKRPQLVLSLAAIQGEQVFLLNSGCKLARHCIFADSDHYRTSDFAGSIYERSVREGKLLIIEDLTSDPAPSPIEEAIIQRGVRNIVVAPLYYQDELIGTLDLGSPNPGDLNAINAMKLGEVLPLFSMAIKRSMEELNTTVQAIIKEKYTAIHPSVEWRFRKAALRVIQQQNAGILSEIEPIVFEGVYPLYGASDIRGSSTLRHAAIQADLVDHLNLVREIFLLAYRHKPLPAALDPHLGILYRRRRDFEESVTRINKTISAYLDAEQGKAQAMFPHYFEKHVTDGVDYGIYIGPSLVEDGKFEVLYLKNLRLWQLMVMCGVARQTERLKASLKVPLEAAHLILVQNTPLSIRFRLDEKQFDVDGAYNIRYEIIKKRIDKAVIKGSAERLTQPGKIAIIYSQAKEALEYRQYIDYLQAAAYLTGEVEEVELEDLQGLQGLKALRVTVNMQPPVIQERAAPAEMEEAIQATSGMVT